MVSTNSIIGNYLMQKLEHPYKPIPINTLERNVAIVVLGGMLHQVGDKNYKVYEFSDPDRFLGGIELIKQSKADKMIFMASKLPWLHNWKPEGFILRDKAISMGVSETKIFVSEKVKNTLEESIAVTKLIPINSSIILVTSAYHMSRSKYLFEKQGFKVTPFPVDFKSLNTKNSIMSFLPNTEALFNTSLFIRENIGRLYYRLFL